MTLATPDVTLATRLAGGVWGHLVGDAVGVPYEFRKPDAIGEVSWGEKGSHRQTPGTWSDDGALMLGLLDSLTADGVGFDSRTRDAARSIGTGTAPTPPTARVFDIGNTTRQALHAIERARRPPMPVRRTRELRQRLPDADPTCRAGGSRAG